MPKWIAIILAGIALGGCSSLHSPTQWDIERLISDTPQYESRRLLVGPDPECPYLALEVIHCNQENYISLLLFILQAPPDANDSSRSEVHINWESGHSEICLPILLAGGQRLLFPKEDATRFIQALLSGLSFSISIGPHTLHIPSQGFYEAFST